jgi:hypothetical protein
VTGAAPPLTRAKGRQPRRRAARVRGSANDSMSGSALFSPAPRPDKVPSDGDDSWDWDDAYIRDLVARNLTAAPEGAPGVACDAAIAKATTLLRWPSPARPRRPRTPEGIPGVQGQRGPPPRRRSRPRAARCGRSASSSQPSGHAGDPARDRPSGPVTKRIADQDSPPGAARIVAPGGSPGGSRASSSTTRHGRWRVVELDLTVVVDDVRGS